MPKISIILPARNEESLIEETLKNIILYLEQSKLTYEILVIINGSQDQTESKTELLIKTNPKIKIQHSLPGYGYALREGLQKSKGEYILVFNVDFYDLKFIDLVKIDLCGKDLIIGSKTAPWSQDNRPLSRKAISALYNLYLKVVFNFHGSDTHGIKIIKKSVVSNILPQCKTNSGIFDSELVLRSQKAGYQIADFPVSIREIRSPRFSKRLIQTPKDIWDLTRALIK